MSEQPILTPLNNILTHLLFWLQVSLDALLVILVEEYIVQSVQQDLDVQVRGGRRERRMERGRK